jgi:hypothetical protein
MGRTCKEVADALHVDLHVGDLDHVLDVGRALDDLVKDLLGDARGDALELVVVDVGALSRRSSGSAVAR